MIDWERRARAAEATVQVLKSKVRDLYDRGAQTAIHRQLEGARRRAEDNRRRREVMEARAEELERYSRHLENEVAERTRDIRTILANVTFGFLLVERELVIRPGFTRSCADLFGRELEAGDRLDEVLGIAGSTRAFELTLGIDQVFEDILPEALTLAQIPDRFVVGDRVIRLEGRAVRSDDGDVDAVLLTVSDITALEEAQRQARRNAVLLSLLDQRGAFQEFVDDARERLAIAAENMSDVGLVRRVIHTVKGNAATFGLDDVVAVAHEVEGRETLDETAVRAVSEAIDAFLDAHADVLGIGASEASRRGVQVPGEALEGLRRRTAHTDAAQTVCRWTEEVLLRPAGEFLGPIPRFVERLAERMGKSVDLEVRGAEVRVAPSHVRPVFRNLSHLLRNALDHGIEVPWERGDKGERAHIAVSISDAPEHWGIEVADDGRGIDVERLRERAAAAGRVDPEQLRRLPDGGLEELVFMDGVSSAEVVTDISGRGVGMSAVRSAVQSVGGTLSITTEAGRGTRVQILVPKPPTLVAEQAA